MKMVDKKLLSLSKWFKGASVECLELKNTVPDYENYNDVLDEIQELCVEIQEKLNKLYI